MFKRQQKGFFLICFFFYLFKNLFSFGQEEPLLETIDSTRILPLHEAIEVTLKYQGLIKISELNVEIKQGIARAIRGSF